MAWDGRPAATDFQGLVQAIRKKTGRRGDVSMDPRWLVAVVGDPETYRRVGPILNLIRDSNELLRLAHGRRSQEKANLITEFRASFSEPNAAWLRHW